jgi:hypothetical protein
VASWLCLPLNEADADIPAPTAAQALEADDTDEYTHSSWADSQSLKRHFAGVASVRVPR